MLDLSFPIASCMFPQRKLVSTEHRADRRQAGVLRREEELQLQLSVRGVSPPVTPPASDIMLRLSSAS